MKDKCIIIYIHYDYPSDKDCPYSAIGRCPFEQEEEYYNSFWYS